MKYIDINKYLFQAPSALKLLINAGADVNAKDDRGNPIVLSFVGKYKMNELQFLLEHGANVNVEDRGGYPLLTGVIMRNQGMELSEIFLEYGADVNAIDAWGKTALIWSIAKADLRNVKFLLDHKADTNIGDIEGNTALMWAVMGNVTNSVFLLSVALNAHPKSTYGSMVSTSPDQMEIIDIILKHGANVNVVNNDGLTPLMIAVRYGYETVVKKLLDAGADINIRNKRGNKILDIAKSYNHDKIVKIINEHRIMSQNRGLVRR